jgi:transcriptional regulator with XRE-family HTH domain
MKDFILLGCKIKEIRTNQKLTQEALANLVNLSPHFLSQIEGGKRKASLDTVFNLAKSLNVPVSYFFEESSDSKKINSNTIESIMAKLKPHEKDLMINILKEITPQIINYRKFK